MRLPKEPRLLLRRRKLRSPVPCRERNARGRGSEKGLRAFRTVRSLPCNPFALLGALNACLSLPPCSLTAMNSATPIRGYCGVLNGRQRHPHPQQPAGHRRRRRMLRGRGHLHCDCSLAVPVPHGAATATQGRTSFIPFLPPPPRTYGPQGDLAWGSASTCTVWSGATH